ncbi:MAG: hypothetical protein Q8K43_02815 [Sulfurimicrobium sp.]|nr:hypothetical protein [Sulfurimicrobium sp.]
MNDEKKQQQNNDQKKLNESLEYAELRQRQNDNATVSMRVPITPSPTRPPDRDNND